MTKPSLYARRILVQAPAKLNLHLAVHELQANQYHRIESIMVSCTLANRLILERVPENKRLEFHCDDPKLPIDDRNLALKAAREWMQAYAKPFGLRMDLSKYVPTGAGLAGGSADAAAVLRGLQFLSQQGVDEARMAKIAQNLGSDVSFCYRGGLALVRGEGQQILPLPSLPKLYLLIAKPKFQIHTKQAFAWLDMDREQGRSEMQDPLPDESLLAPVRGEVPMSRWPAIYRNDFEGPMQVRYPSIARLLKQLRSSGADYSAMSGSGPSCYGLFRSANKRDAVATDLERRTGLPLTVACAETASADAPISYRIEVLA